MEDVFLEYLVKRKRTASDMIKAAGVIAGGVLLSLMLLVGIVIVAGMLTAPDGSGAGARQTVFTIGLILVALVWYLVVHVLNAFNVEYEYILTNNELDIDKILGKKTRKHLVTIDICNASLMARIDDRENNSVYKAPPEGVSIRNYSAMSNTGFTYFIDCNLEKDNSDTERSIVLFQPTQKMVDALWRSNPRAVKK